MKSKFIKAKKMAMNVAGKLRWSSWNVGSIRGAEKQTGTVSKNSPGRSAACLQDGTLTGLLEKKSHQWTTEGIQSNRRYSRPRGVLPTRYISLRRKPNKQQISKHASISVVQEERARCKQILFYGMDKGRLNMAFNLAFHSSESPESAMKCIALLDNPPFEALLIKAKEI